MGVENHHRVVVEHLEHVRAQLPQASDERGVVPVVELSASGLRQHDCGDMRQQARAYHLTHGVSSVRWPALYRKHQVRDRGNRQRCAQ